MTEATAKDPLRISIELAQDGEVSAALELLERALQHESDVPHQRRARWCKNAGMFCEELNRLEQAVSHYRNALELEPTDGFTHLILAALYSTLGREHEAARHRAVAVRLAAEDEELAEVVRQQQADRGDRL